MTSKVPDPDDILPRDHPLRRLPGSVFSRVSGGLERMKEDISALFRGPVFPHPYPDPRPPHAPLLSPAALSVLVGPSMTGSEIERFKQDLQNALAEVNQCVEPTAKGRLSAYDKREEVVHIIKLLEVHAADVKYAIDVGVSSGKVSKEGAQELKSLIDHLVLAMRDVHQWKSNFSISKLTALLALPMRVGPLVSQVSAFVGFVQGVLLFRDIISPPKDGPGLFRDIGKRAKAMLCEEYLTYGLGVVLNSESTDELSMIAGFKVTDQNIISRSFVNLKNANLSIDMNAVLNGNSVTKITVDDAWASDTKCILSIPVPWRNSPKFEYECLGPYYGITASTALHPHPVVDFSGLWGNRLMSAGFRLELNTATSALSNYAAGLTVVRDHSAFGLTINNHGLLTGTIWNDIVPKRSYVPNMLRRFVDPILSYLSPDVITTQVGAMFDFCFASNRMRCMIGVNHEFDSDTSLKARIDTSGGATAMVKRKIGEKAFVSASTEVNLNDVWRLPRVGVCLSLNQ